MLKPGNRNAMLGSNGTCGAFRSASTDASTASAVCWWRAPCFLHERLRASHLYSGVNVNGYTNTVAKKTVSPTPAR